MVGQPGPIERLVASGSHGSVLKKVASRVIELSRNRREKERRLEGLREAIATVIEEAALVHAASRPMGQSGLVVNEVVAPAVGEHLTIAFSLAMVYREMRLDTDDAFSLEETVKLVMHPRWAEADPVARPHSKA